MSTTLGALEAGAIVTLRENGVPAEFYVGTQDYESGLNGPGRTLLVRKDVYQEGKWNSDNVNAYAGSTIDDWFNNDYLQMLDPGIAYAAGQTEFYYTVGNYNIEISTLKRPIFGLSLTEIGKSGPEANIEGSILPIASTLQIVYKDDSATTQWTRSAGNTSGNNTIAWWVEPNGDITLNYCSGIKGYRPCLTLPSTLTVNDDNSVQPPAITLGNAPVGSIIKINENGKPVNHIVVNQGIPGNSPLYDQSCDGTWVLRQDIVARGKWNSSNVNTLPNSAIMQTMAGYLSLYDPGIQASIKTVKIPYCVGNGSGTVMSGANGLECQIFPLGGYEVGWTQNDQTIFPIDGAKLDYFISGTSSSADNKRKAILNGTFNEWTTRSPLTNSGNFIWEVYEDGDSNNVAAIESHGLRPAFILPQNLTVMPDGTLQATPTFNTLPIQVMEGQSLTITWSAMDGATAYTLQRQVDGGEWTQVYSGADTTYTDTVPAGTTLQYQVQATIDGTPGAFGQSGVISVISASALAISGTDSNLGTITNDITYAVSTDTGNEITLTRTVNGELVATLTVDNGFAYTIPVMDLPTGSGTIVVSASVQGSSGPVSATRTWQYTKTAMSFPDSGGPAQLTKNGQNLFPATLAEAVRVPTNWGGSLDKALELLYPAVNSAVISVGTYEGTGTFGQDNPNTLTFDDTPLVVTIYGGGQTLVISSTDTSSQAYIDGNTAKWYSTENAAAQMNASGTTYSYVAVGKGQVSA